MIGIVWWKVSQHVIALRFNIKIVWLFIKFFSYVLSCRKVLQLNIIKQKLQKSAPESYQDISKEEKYKKGKYGRKWYKNLCDKCDKHVYVINRDWLSIGKNVIRYEKIRKLYK